MDNSDELLSLRSEISSQVSRWFKKKIQIDERLLQILEYAPSCEDGWMDSADIFSATMVHLPSISNLLIRAGVKPESIESTATKLNKLASFNRSGIVRPDIESTLFLPFLILLSHHIGIRVSEKRGVCLHQI